ncbi:hypothetical protein GOARA_028_00120 [Gordonia araii NBRC 100433]|uniref:Uncharacterized protein n=1 Tax=Gordonia araii NBRC 100433 TaxID=1073574 RepID=G7GZS6_9ACTN|nr:hypothetical protein [Gordonia araii]NNG98784.1 hypothetical protein [Gordonia araii NBRC 100433]GAB09101.1 hypothetical protein GOARA_028_00120 [Gordonia araii NBRC 100433]
MAEQAWASARWREAVGHGSRGAVARGRAVLDELDPALRHSGDVDARAMRSLALSTRASWLRQAGRHDFAAGLDGRAAVEVADQFPSPRPGWARAAVGDALVGLAADNLGLGRFDSSSRLLIRAGDVLVGRGENEPASESVDDWLVDGRVVLRWHWVNAENALYRGDADTGRQWAERAANLAAECPSTHHKVKTRLIVAAAMAAEGDSAAATERAREVVEDASTAGLLPLQWAGLQMVVALSPAGAELARLNDVTAKLRESGFFRVGISCPAGTAG